MVRLSSGGSVVTGEAVFRFLTDQKPRFGEGVSRLDCFVAEKGRRAIEEHISHFGGEGLELISCFTIDGKDREGKAGQGHCCNYLWKRGSVSVELSVYDGFFHRFGICSVNDSLVLSDGRIAGALAFKRESSKNRTLIVFPPEVVVSARHGKRLEVRSECLAEGSLRGSFSQVKLVENPFVSVESSFFSARNEPLIRFVRDLHHYGIGRGNTSTVQQLLKISSLTFQSSIQDRKELQKILKGVAHNYQVEIVSLNPEDRRKINGSPVLLSFIWTHANLKGVEWRPFKEIGFEESFQLSTLEPSVKIEGFIVPETEEVTVGEPEEKKWWKFWN